MGSCTCVAGVHERDRANLSRASLAIAFEDLVLSLKTHATPEVA
jgi:hypothetical protein